ncbi:hypothetical protein [Chryseosolibacter indicus]|uniref:MFS transporter n=1 Tax=Chryseosolibacter indicus TaxID=2782351 RepID=A0ABS5VQ66_9BACT|nr:hypothetical protein [Chryseosolibacter indicus]MBT1702151.1 hypothetical protein [Chryseosolibacter indicus]
MKRSVTAKQFFLTLNLTYYLQACSVLFFSLVVAFLISRSTNSGTDTQMWGTVIPLVLIISLVIAYSIFRMMVKRISKNFVLTKKMPMYARAVLTRSVLLQLPGFLAAIAGYITMQLYFIGGSILIFILFLILKPTRVTIANDLNLSVKERSLLENEQAIVSEVE